MVLLTYQLPREITRVAEEGEFDEFDLNSFFEAVGKGDDAVYKFKRYEDASLNYSGIDRHADERLVGGYSTVITQEEYQDVN